MSCVRKSIFNILLHNQLYSNLLKNAFVLDLFCGSGAFGIEALSHGARHVFMMDCNIDNVRVNSLPFKENITIISADASAAPKSNTACDIIFVDPPYNMENYEMILHNLVVSQWVKYGTVVILETASKKRDNHFSRYQLIDERKYSKTRILILRSMTYNAQEVHKLILNEFSDAEISVEDTVGDSNHFSVVVASSQFRDKGMLEQHRMVYAALKGKVGEAIHALKLKTIIKE